MKLSIITLLHNKLEYTKKYIESLYKYTKDFELILVENGSTDGTLEYIKSLKYENIKTIINKENLGFSKGNNQGIDIAEGEYIGFLNNDILLYPNWFEECEKVFQKENAAFVSPRQINPYIDNTNEKKYISYFKKLNFRKSYEKSLSDCAFSCVLTKHNIIDNLKGFDESYTPAFFEDDDFKCRAIEAGYNIYTCNKVCFFHFGSVTSVEFNHNFENNRIYFYDKYKYGEYFIYDKNLINQLRHQIKLCEKFPCNLFLRFHILKEKGLNRLRRFFR